MIIYPTKEEILEHISKTEDLTEEKRIMEFWKETHWNKLKNRKKEIRIETIKHLIYLICNTKRIKTDIRHDKSLASAYYEKRRKRIYLNNDSIISALHELGHAIYGEKELYACAFSVALFMHTFPKAYEKLIWDGHMLKKPII